MEKYKVVVLGAGVSGLSTALYLHKNNINDFIVLNPTNHDTHKACTGLLTEKTISLLKELDISLEGYEKVNTFKAKFNGEYIKDFTNSGLSLYHHIDTGREYINNSLYEKCLNCGTKIIENCKNIEVNKRTKTVSCSNGSYGYEILVDARGFYLDINNTKRKDIGFECKLTHKINDISKHGEIILSKKFKGYAWIIYGQKYDVIGFVDEYKPKCNYNNILQELIQSDYKGQYDEIETKGAFVPVRPRKLLVNKNYIQIGDKAGLVDPLTQEGIYYSLLSAKVASAAIINNNLLKYRKNMSFVVKNFRFAYFTRKLFFSEKYQTKLWNLCKNHNFPDYVFSRYSNDLTPFIYSNIKKYHDDYKRFKTKQN